MTTKCSHKSELHHWYAAMLFVGLGRQVKLELVEGAQWRLTSAKLGALRPKGYKVCPHVHIKNRLVQLKVYCLVLGTRGTESM